MICNVFMLFKNRFVLFLPAFIFISGCERQIENGVVYTIGSEGAFTNTMVVGEEAVEKSLEELFDLMESKSGVDRSKKRLLIQDMGGHLAYQRFMGSATPTEKSDKYAEYGINYYIWNNSEHEMSGDK